jgi:hypothetical protein
MRCRFRSYWNIGPTALRSRRCSGARSLIDASSFANVWHGYLFLQLRTSCGGCKVHSQSATKIMEITFDREILCNLLFLRQFYGVLVPGVACGPHARGDSGQIGMSILLLRTQSEEFPGRHAVAVVLIVTRVECGPAGCTDQMVAKSWH